MFGIEDVYKAGFALGGLSILVLLLGLLGLITPVYLAAACVLAALCYAATVRRRRRDVRHVARLSPLEIVLVVLIVALVLAMLPLALTPPAVRDELIQHLAVPKLYLARGRIFEIPYMGFSYLPLNIDMLYMVPLAFGNDVVPRLIHMGFGVLTALVVYYYLLPGSGRGYALLGFFLYLATPLVFNLSHIAYVDNGSAFYSTLALVGVLKWREDFFNPKWLLYAAVAMGLALGAKYNTLISFLLINFYIVYAYSKDRKSPVRALFAAAIFSFTALAVLSPWLLRSYVWKGNPFYPLWESAAHAAAKGEGIHVTSEMAPVAKRYFLYHESTFDMILLPLRVFWEGVDNSIRHFDGVLNPFYLVFIPLAFIARRRGDGELKGLALFSVLFFVMAFLTVDLVTRYLLPVIPLVIIFVTLGFRNLFETRSLGWLAAVALGALLVFDGSYVVGLYRRNPPFSYLTGRISREQYLTGRLPDYDAVSWANRKLPTDAKVMLVFSGDRGYYWQRPYSYGDRMGVFLQRYVRTSGDAAALEKKFASGGVTHLFLNDALTEKFINDNFNDDRLKLLADFFNDHTTRLYSANGYSLYALR